MRLLAVLGIGIFLLSSPLIAQDSARAEGPRIAVTGQVRLRSEWDDRHVLADQRVNVHLLRSRLRATAHPVAWVTVVGEVQDARFLGESDPDDGRGTTDASAPQLDMHQAFAQVDSPFHLPLMLRFGRQEMTFANERLIGVSAWSNTGRSFDGARATWFAARTLSVDAWADRLSAPSAAAIGAQNFYGAWATWKPVRAIAADVFALRDDNTARIRSGDDLGRRVLGRSTLGANLRGTAGRLAVELEGAGQTGRGAASDSVAREEIRAFMGSVTASVALLPRTQTRLGGVLTVLSGDGSPGDGRDERFSTLFGTNHRLYGTIDIVPELSGTHGLVDAGVTLAHAPIPAVRLLLEGHRFLPQRGDDAFGSEADLTAAWRAAPPFEISGGASAFAPGKLLETRLGGGTRFSAYIQGQWDF
ncbi:alginate export family protein [Longimicrobium sp.]|uniref:alginate export family protein n=1 Tax=Longimicrobium sp. TaxID=2029185 RepID=UPI002B51019C|nr:alginate export family protein [Longimicrobium sp.]HSU17665.1 alginate export family protein [Longimicrobium sp.]